jgi:glucans biosynthesis protein
LQAIFKARSRFAHANQVGPQLVKKREIEVHPMKYKRAIGLTLLFILLSYGSLAFRFSDVESKARNLAENPYQPPTNQVPKSLSGMNYVEHQGIQFNHKQTIWSAQSLPFGLEFFHPGAHSRDMVTIHLIERDEIKTVRFNTNYFLYPTNFDIPDGLSFSGFRVTQPRQRNREVAAFLGASYFRMIGLNQAYGASARGLALNTLSPQGEEFPVFEEFWIQTPKKSANQLTVYALMNSPSVTGAYQFIIRPGESTIANVKAVLYPRLEVKEFGLAPLTSFFLHGKNGRPLFNDFRPEVHDSDGLLINNGKGEWIWHPLEHGAVNRVNTFMDQNPRGFGLMQRERDYENYQDPLARFELRPSVWVKPRGKWGKGVVKLVQLTSDREYYDNVVAYWLPEEAPRPGRPLEIEYDLHWTNLDPLPATLGRVRATRVGRTAPDVKPINLRFVVDFEGRAVESLSAKEKLFVDIHPDPWIKVITHSCEKSAINETWRLVLEIVEPEKTGDVRALLRRGREPITETWNFTWQR